MLKLHASLSLLSLLTKSEEAAPDDYTMTHKKAKDLNEYYDYHRFPKSYSENHWQHHVEILNSKNFEEKVVKSSALWVIEFHTEKCYHCRLNIEIFRETAKKFAGENRKKDCELEVNTLNPKPPPNPKTDKIRYGVKSLRLNFPIG